MKPTSVKKIIDELILQVGLIIYTDVADKKIVVRALRNLVASMSLTDDSFMGQLTTKFDSDKRISQVLMFYAQKNPLEKSDEEKNYSAILNSFSGDAVAALEGASAAIKKIYGTWVTIFNRPAAEAVSGYLLRRYGRAPRSIGFKLPVNVPLKLGSVFTLDSIKFEDSQGMKLPPVLFQAVSIEPNATGSTVQGEQVPTGQAELPDGVAVINVDEDSFNLNLRAVYDSIYTTPVAGDEVQFVLASGVFIGSVYTNAFALYRGDWPADVIVKIIGDDTNRIQGAGGDGAVGPYPANPARQGGHAIYLRGDLEIVGDIEIFSGGGGGGYNSLGFSYVTGGGGSGYLPGIPDGTRDSGGGGVGPQTQGGDPGMAGGSGTGPGAAAGIAIDGVSFLTFTGTPDIRGSQIN